MKDSDKRQSAKAFAAYWQDKGDEKQETQAFWLSLLHSIFGIDDPTKIIDFEKRANTGYIDAYLPATRVLIEQKSRDIDLRKEQSAGKTPYQQAREYAASLPHSEHPRYIITCNFHTFLIYDQEKPFAEPEVIKLCDLAKEYHRLDFIVKERDELLHHEEEISIKAGLLVGKLYDALLKQYRNPESDETLRSLNKLCVRLVFCLYAEDANIFQCRLAFHNYIARFEPRDIRRALIDLFEVLDTKPEDRDPYLDDSLAAFPYVNGGLFADAGSVAPQSVAPQAQPEITKSRNYEITENAPPKLHSQHSTLNTPIEIPNFTEEIKQLLLRNASEDFDWSSISPTIFGAVFESTLNPETRRKGGMHYTSIENIHKVIDPLFLDNLRAELEEICQIKNGKQRKDNAEKYINRLANLTFLDPACGSGNFLTETYISLRRLENEALRIIYEDEKLLDLGGIIKVNINQFYGIEINDFAVTVAKTALWIAESQMLKETEDIVHTDIDFLPLKSYSGIVEGNALRMDWAKVVAGAKMGGDASCVGKNEHNNNAPGSRTSQADAGSVAPQSVIPQKLNYIMGNPPFIGARLMSKEQKDDLLTVFGAKWKNVGNLDYVSCWYKKAADLMQGTNIRAALVSTNSVSQGESVATLWKPLFENGVQIDFAHRTFRWDSEASAKAHVHCVIIGFSCIGDNATTGEATHLRGPHRTRSEWGGFASANACNENLTDNATIGGRRILASANACNNGGKADAGSVAPQSVAPQKIIYDGDKKTIAKNINGYLLDADNVFVESRSKPLCDVPEIGIGNKPIDGGYYLFTEEEKDEFIKIEPQSEKYFRPWIGSHEFINRYYRYCLWLGECTPAELRAMPECMKRVQAVRDYRLSSPSAGTVKLADTPTRFHVENMPKGNYVVVPEVSSEKRRYIPIGFFEPYVLSSNLVKIIPSATLYHFGVLTSSVHMAWMRAVCGRLKSDYRYSKDIVYNNFPWPIGGETHLRGPHRTRSEWGGFASANEHNENLTDKATIGGRRIPASANACNENLTDNADAGSVAPQSVAPQSKLCASLWEKISETAQSILDARALYPDSSLADLYDELTMPPELRKAHQANDRAVLEAYGLPKDITEPEIVAHLMALYRQLTAKDKQ